MANTVKLKYVFIVKFQVAGILCPFDSNFPPVPIWYGIIPYYGNVVFVLESLFACLDYIVLIIGFLSKYKEWKIYKMRHRDKINLSCLSCHIILSYFVHYKHNITLTLFIDMKIR